MRFTRQLAVTGLALVLGFALSACAASSTSATNLAPADAATSLSTNGPLRMNVTTQRPSVEGDDPLITMTLTRADGRSMRFQQANHTNNDLMAQAPDGPLAQMMGLFGEAQLPQLYQSVEGGSGAPFLCAPDGPLMLGYYRAESGEVTIIGLKSNFEFETRADGTTEALPFSPDHVCTRLHFRAG